MVGYEDTDTLYEYSTRSHASGHSVSQFELVNALRSIDIHFASSFPQTETLFTFEFTLGSAQLHFGMAYLY
jgi:hypothetical protein